MQGLIKVCGLTDNPINYEVLKLNGITHVGFIFVPSSPRYTQRTFPTPGIKRTGVFVNASESEIHETVLKHRLDVVQLHGNETPELCQRLQHSCEVIKAFGIADSNDFHVCEAFHGSCDLFLFDTKTSRHGGSGTIFDWQLLTNYTGPTPFLLSGGIGLSSIEALKRFAHPFCAGLDLNSRFELEPGIKNYELIQTFIHELTNQHTIYSRS